MSKTVRYAILAFVLMGSQPGVSAREIPLVAGTLLECSLNEPSLSSRTAIVGDPLVCYARPLHEFGCAAFPRGTQLAGRFVEYRNPGRLVGKGWIKLEFDRLILANGEAPITARVISVHGFKVDAGGRILGHGHARRDAVGWVIPVLWPIKVATLLSRGPVPTLKGERLVTLRLLDDVRIPCQGFGTGLLESSWRPFDSLRQSDLPSSPSSLNISGASGSSLTADRPTRGVSTGEEQTVRTDDNSIVIDSGTHALRITSTRPKPAPRTPPWLSSPR